VNLLPRYPIGTAGKKWGEPEKAQWLERQHIKRSYAEHVLQRLQPLKQHFDVEQYGKLSCGPERYPLLAVRSVSWSKDKITALITGGVHGYETSGVQGALRFLETRAADFLDDFNLVVAPCVSPWGYETINRWNPSAVDPNRSFFPNNSCEEAAALMDYVKAFASRIKVHIDLHETTDTDNSEFRPALAARDAQPQDNWSIPDGFYLVGQTDKPAAAFHRAIIAMVEKTTHIALSDPNGLIIGEKLEQKGVINYDARALGLCMGMTDAAYVATTEVYPDSAKVDAENCIMAQVAAVVGGLEWVRQ